MSDESIVPSEGVSQSDAPKMSPGGSPPDESVTQDPKPSKESAPDDQSAQVENAPPTADTSTLGETPITNETVLEEESPTSSDPASVTPATPAANGSAVEAITAEATAVEATAVEATAVDATTVEATVSADPAGKPTESTEPQVTSEATLSANSATTPPKESAAKVEGAEENFEKLLQESDASPSPKEVKVGDRIRGKIVKIQEDQTFVDFGGRAEAAIATSELRGDGKVLLREGDALSATVSATEDGIQITLGKKRGAVNAAKLRVAFEGEVPISGTVKKINKGGFDVSVGGVRTFCPLSQIENSFVEKPDSHVGKTYTFLILRWENGGRNIVVSRRAILKKEADLKAETTRQTLKEGAEFEGVITRVQNFGAFVDIGGLEGLIHISRMGHGHIDNPNSVVAAGQKLTVRVVKIENPGTSKERIGLSMAALGPDPWDSVQETLHEGDVVEGKVARLTAFGAFITLENGVDGLVHISEISYKHISDPKEVLSPEQTLSVKILNIDPDKKRLSLSIKQASGETPPPQSRRPARRRTGSPVGGDSLSVGQGPLTHTMADQLGALKNRIKPKQT